MKTTICILGFALSGTLSFSTHAQILTLEQVKEKIIQSHPSVRMFDAEAQSMDVAAKGAWSWMPPEIGTGLFMMPYNPKYTRETEMREGMGQFSISFQQMFPNRKRQSAEYRYMSTMSSVVKEKKEASINELIAQAKKNYFDWIIIKKKVIVLDQNERLLDFIIKNSEIRYKNGMGKLSAYYKAKAALGNIQNMRLIFENDINLRRINLNTLMNRNTATPVEIDTIFSLPDYSNLQLDSTSLIQSRSDLRAIERDMDLIGLQQQLEQAKLKPELGFRFEHMLGTGGQPLRYTAMAMFRLPFASWASKMNKANIESQKWRHASLGFERQMYINELTGMASTLLNEATTKRKQLKLYEENIIPSLQNNYKIMQLGYEQNTEELFQLYDAWETLNMAQLEYLDQLQQFLSIQVELERILEIK